MRLLQSDRVDAVSYLRTSLPDGIQHRNGSAEIGAGAETARDPIFDVHVDEITPDRIVPPVPPPLLNRPVAALPNVRANLTKTKQHVRLRTLSGKSAVLTTNPPLEDCPRVRSNAMLRGCSPPSTTGSSARSSFMRRRCCVT